MLWPIPLAGTLPPWLIVILTLIDLAIRVLAVGIIPGNRRPTTAMAWLLGIFFVPSVGLVLFLLFGNFRLSRRRRAQQQAVNTRVRAGASALASLESRLRRARMGGVGGRTEQDAGLAADGGRQQRGAAARLPGLHQGHGRRGPGSQEASSTPSSTS